MRCVLDKSFWLYGGEIGVNEHGVAVGNEAVFSNGPAEGDGVVLIDLLAADAGARQGSARGGGADGRPAGGLWPGRQLRAARQQPFRRLVHRLRPDRRRGAGDGGTRLGDARGRGLHLDLQRLHDRPTTGRRPRCRRGTAPRSTSPRRSAIPARPSPAARGERQAASYALPGAPGRADQRAHHGRSPALHRRGGCVPPSGWRAPDPHLHACRPLRIALLAGDRLADLRCRDDTIMVWATGTSGPDCSVFKPVFFGVAHARSRADAARERHAGRLLVAPRAPASARHGGLCRRSSGICGPRSRRWRPASSTRPKPCAQAPARQGRVRRAHAGRRPTRSRPAGSKRLERRPYHVAHPAYGAMWARFNASAALELA